ncbi:MAG: glycosyltransferase family 4 protein [Candidatus Rokubacteria bacterium]|nr:glycosyltransferase family 4 protein [Candidatus Rokubacteria bacterium]
MKVAVATEGFPSPTSGGGALTVWSLLRYLVEAGHRVSVLVLDDFFPSPSRLSREQRIADVMALGVSVVPVQPEAGAVRAERSILPRLQHYYRGIALRPQLEQSLRAWSPDVVFAYHFDALAAVYGTDIGPVVAAVGDPSHLPLYYRWRGERPRLTKSYLRLTAGTAVALLCQPRYMRSMMSRAARTGAFAAHHAAWFRRIGVRHCQYFRTPVIDDAGRDWEARRRAYEPRRTKFKLLLIGHLEGIATLSGLHLFARSVLPVLERRLGPDRFDVHIVGGHAAPPELQRLLSRPVVRMRGQLEPASEEFLSCDVLVVPTPIELGVRVRILTGFSFGCCLVTHRANQAGIPELQHGVNALLAGDGEDMAEMIIEALDDGGLRDELGKNARVTYEENFAIDVAGRRLAAVMASARR